MKPDDLSFSYRTTKAGEVFLERGGRTVAVLRGGRADKFLGAIERADAATQQQILARYTGNYRRGNEQRAASHLRNRLIRIHCPRGSCEVSRFYYSFRNEFANRSAAITRSGTSSEPDLPLVSEPPSCIILRGLPMQRTLRNI